MWILFALGSAVLTAIVGTLTKAGLDKVEPTLAVALQSTVLMIVAWVVVIVGRKYTGLGDVTPKAGFLIAAAGATTMVGYLCYFRGLAAGPSSAVQPLDRLSLVFAVLLAGVFLREKITPAAIGGTVLMTIGALVIALGGSKS